MLNISEAVKVLRAGGIIAYPTEAVYGLGCDPSNADAVGRLLELKSRPESAGLILISDEFSRVAGLVGEVDGDRLAAARATWPGPVTWLFPKSALVPGWISGDHDSVALRITDHDGCRQLCAAFGEAIVSTSANRSGGAPARTAEQVMDAFVAGIAGVVEGELGGRAQPSEIRDIRTGKVIRLA